MALIVNLFKHQRVTSPTRRQEEDSDDGGGPDWVNLPYNATLEVAKYLNDNERAAMAQVCKNWKTVVRDPALWRGRGFLFGGPVAEKPGQRAVEFVKQHGCHLHHVSVQCVYHPGVVNESIARTLKRFLNFLGRANLLTLRLDCADLRGRWESNTYRDKIAFWFGNFIRTQNKLRMFGAVYTLFQLKEGTRLLEHLTAMASNKLECLELVAYFAFGVAACRDPDYVMTLKNFTQLVIVHLSYSCINEEILLEWAQHKTLASLHLLVHRTDPHDHVIPNAVWREVKDACPHLIVLFSIMDIDGTSALLSLLQPAAPLCRLVIKMSEFFDIGPPLQREQNLTIVLRHVAFHYGRCLQDIVLDLSNSQSDHLDSAIVGLFTSCKALKKISVTGQVGQQVRQALDELKEKDHVTVRTFDITNRRNPIPVVLL